MFGAGAVGSGVAAALCMVGHKVTLVGRNTAHLDAVASQGLQLGGVRGESHLFPGVSRSIPHTTELLILTVKSGDTREAARAIRDQGYNGEILHLQNGIGNYEVLCEFFPHAKIFSGMIIIGFKIPQPGSVEITVYGGDIQIGQISGEHPATAERLAALFNDSILVAHLQQNITGWLWSKLLYNASLNPLGAILNVPYGQLLHPELTPILRSVIEEAYQVARRLGVEMLQPSAADYFALLCNQLIPPTAAHRSSMIQDLEHGRKTEIGALNGALLALGEQLNIELPTNRLLTHQIRFLESGGKASNDGRNP